MKNEIFTITTILIVFGLASISSATTFEFSYEWASGGILTGTFEGEIDPDDSNHVIATTPGLTSAWYNNEAITGLTYAEPYFQWYIDGAGLRVTFSAEDYIVDIHNISGATMSIYSLDPLTYFENETMISSRWRLFQEGLNADRLAMEGTDPVPEPAVMFLFGMGLLGLAGLGRRRNQFHSIQQ